MDGSSLQGGDGVRLAAVPDLSIEISGSSAGSPPEADAGALPLWHVRVTLAGAPTDPQALSEALRGLCEANPFLASVRYNAERAEVTYWDEAEDADDAAALALRVWHDHRRRLGLPAWEVVGLEVVDRDTRAVRGDSGTGTGAGPSAIGDVRPF